MAGLAAFGLLAAGCAAGGTGARDEGAAMPAPVERAVPKPTESSVLPVRMVDAVELLRRDPKVSPQIKADLKPCDKDAYPVDTSYGDLTGSTSADIVVNVMTCGDAVGVGTYVYRERSEKYENVFADEQPAAYATIDRGKLVVTQPVYAKGDPVSYPSGEDVVTYIWADSKFTERYRVRNDYSDYGHVVGREDLQETRPAEPRATPEN
ncbi:hypothetical protein [Streptomyces sp. NPDC088725]|uniref:hypothetical protein n=1 Tax=Streptomyces sp. NPDC088725 TaxID=3365873 RepID=UPI0037F90ADB